LQDAPEDGLPAKGGKKRKDAHLWERHPEDWYVEPRWVSERLFHVERFEGEIVDPSCGLGRIVESARSAGLHATGFDLRKRSDVCQEERDFLSWQWPIGRPIMNIVSNPPYKHIEEFVDLALQRARYKVALLLPVGRLTGDTWTRQLQATPLRRVLFLTARPSMPPGPVIEAGINPGGGEKDFAWYIWLRGYDGEPEISWLRRDG